MGARSVSRTILIVCDLSMRGSELNVFRRKRGDCTIGYRRASSLSGAHTTFLFPRHPQINQHACNDGHSKKRAARLDRSLLGGHVFGVAHLVCCLEHFVAGRPFLFVG